MEDPILDRYGEFDGDVQVVAVKYFFLASEAYLYAARLREAGIAHFLTNANTVTTLPLAGPSVGLYVRETDLPAAAALIARMDYQKAKPVSEQSFRDADHEDIEYQRALHRGRQADWLFLIILTLIGLVILRALLRASGIFNAWGDAF